MAALSLLTGCGGISADSTVRHPAPEHRPPSGTGPPRLPGVGDRLHSKIPSATRQVVAVYGEDEDSAKSTVVLYQRRGNTWSRDRHWPAHNGRCGWTENHREGDHRSPIGVFTLSDAGGTLPAPGTKMPYTHSAAFDPPDSWPRSYQNGFDHVIAIDYNRLRGTPPNDPARPQGRAKGGNIWLHVGHGSGSAGCVGVPRSAMEHLLRVLDPARHPVIVMGDRENLAS
ncbi:MAG TPA: L,D-transpeptidase family protein [Streptomyces sp.]|nr:L,D-transpeptidase family protein [Streptomyces sp.]